jgi:hypothetical protein
MYINFIVLKKQYSFYKPVYIISTSFHDHGKYYSEHLLTKSYAKFLKSDKFIFTFVKVFGAVWFHPKP